MSALVNRVYIFIFLISIPFCLLRLQPKPTANKAASAGDGGTSASAVIANPQEVERLSKAVTEQVSCLYIVNINIMFF